MSPCVPCRLCQSRQAAGSPLAVTTRPSGAVKRHRQCKLKDKAARRQLSIQTVDRKSSCSQCGLPLPTIGDEADTREAEDHHCPSGGFRHSVWTRSMGNFYIPSPQCPHLEVHSIRSKRLWNI